MTYIHCSTIPAHTHSCTHCIHSNIVAVTHCAHTRCIQACVYTIILPV